MTGEEKQALYAARRKAWTDPLIEANEARVEAFHQVLIKHGIDITDTKVVASLANQLRDRTR